MPASKRPLAAMIDFTNNMDARAWRVVWAALIMILVGGAIILVSRIFLSDQIEASVRAWLDGAERAHWGLPAAIIVFTLAAFIGAPQFVLIAACVGAFGPERGFWYAWAATIVSGAVTFFTGRIAGAWALRRYGGATGGRFSQFMDKNAFLASFIVRSLPTAPFVVVNVAMAAAGMKFLPFIAGLALGVLPKTAIFTFGYDGLLDAIEGNAGGAATAAGLAIAIWLGFMIFVRRFVRREDKAVETLSPPENATSLPDEPKSASKTQ